MCAPSRRGGGGPGATRTRRPPLGSWPGGLRPSRWRPVSTPGQAEARRGRGLHRQGAGRGVSGAARTAPHRPAHSSSDPDGVSGRHGRGVDGAQAGKERVRTIAAARQASAVGLMPVVAAGVGAPGRPDVPCRRLYSCWTALRGVRLPKYYATSPETPCTGSTNQYSGICDAMDTTLFLDLVPLGHDLRCHHLASDKFPPSRTGRFGCRIAVGMPITEHPPHRSGQAGFPHPAPTLGV